MASLRHLSTDHSYELTSAHLVGRGHTCSLQLSSLLVSGEHATVRWTGSEWEVRDLGSSNGTYVDSRRLEPGESVAITSGSQLAFGNRDDVFAVEEVSPPVAAAFAVAGESIYAEQATLFIPNSDDPEFIVFECGQGQWQVEGIDGTQCFVHDGEQLQAGGRIWRLSLPVVRVKTSQPETGPISLSDITLRFTVSRNEEHVEIMAVGSTRSIALPDRAHNYLLLTLARARRDDCRNADIAEADRGWLYIPELVRMLDITEGQLRVGIHRARSQLKQADVFDARGLVERRPVTREVRLGVSRIEISS
ncbi:MAG: FHA domain-containing protein [Proteobacteria bacterium]|nr:FHA domain-containing protein [Pseudomonadota bacterium]